MRPVLKVWRDRSDRISVLRVVTLICLFSPLGKAIYDSDTIKLDARPITNLIHRTGDWALIFLLVALAVRPLSRILRFNRLLDVRRMIGVGAFAYAAAHFTLYTFDLNFDWREIASEIVHRNRLTLGFVALLGLMALTATSTDGMVRALGGLRWRRLQQVIYLIALLGIVHFFQQTKLDVSVPTLVAGLFTWLMGYRLVAWLWKRPVEIPTWLLLALAVAASALTFLGEAIGFGIAFNVSPLAVLQQTAFVFDLDNPDMIRPGWYVLAGGLAICVLDLVCARLRARRPRNRAASRTAAKPSSKTVRETA